MWWCFGLAGGMPLPLPGHADSGPMPVQSHRHGTLYLPSLSQMRHTDDSEFIVAESPCTGKRHSTPNYAKSPC
jgi:hypothetical protein